MSKAWPTIEFDVDREHEDLASWLMVHAGALGCEVKPSDEQTKQVGIVATFDGTQLSQTDLNRIRASFEEYGLASCLNSLRVKSIVEEDWLAKWKEGFEPFVVGEQFMIVPSWCKDNLKQVKGEANKDRHAILIEPGMAFGTGLHATTQFCLCALEKHLHGKDVLDVGTGSGILAIAAKLMRPDLKIIGFDTDEQAVKLAAINCKLSGLESDAIELLCGTSEIVQGKTFDVICSNMTCEDILALLPEYVRLSHPGTKILCAGILLEKRDLFKKGVAEFPFSVIEEKENGMWVGIVLERK